MWETLAGVNEEGSALAGALGNVVADPTKTLRMGKLLGHEDFNGGSVCKVTYLLMKWARPAAKSRPIPKAVKQDSTVSATIDQIECHRDDTRLGCCSREAIKSGSSPVANVITPYETHSAKTERKPMASDPWGVQVESRVGSGNGGRDKQGDG